MSPGQYNQFTKPAQRADQAAFAHTVKAPAPSLSLGGRIYNFTRKQCGHWAKAAKMPPCLAWDEMYVKP